VFSIKSEKPDEINRQIVESDRPPGPSNDFQKSPKTSKYFQKFPKISKNFRPLSDPSDAEGWRRGSPRWAERRSGGDGGPLFAGAGP
jgi:hypothetical protein